MAVWIGRPLPTQDLPMKSRSPWTSPYVAAALLLAAEVHVSAQVTSAPPLGAVQGIRSRLTVDVRDPATERGTPCRITIVDDRRQPAPLRAAHLTKLAVRPGVVYSPDGRAEVELPPGSYTIYASRGFEWGVDRKTVTLAGGDAAAV